MQRFGLPQTLTGNEIVTIEQQQNGQPALCSMPLSELVAFILTQLPSPTSWVATLSTQKPSTAGVAWNDSGVVAIS